MIQEEQVRKLIAAALDAREHSYSPYSGYAVGATLLTKDGKIYKGCNIENASYSPSNCAERTAFFQAVYEGERNFAAIAVVGSPKGKVTGYAYPCGVCRQVMMEFCRPEEFEIITALSEAEYRKTTLAQILPYGFGPDSLSHNCGK